ncbi:MAG: hypothetical protein M1832_004780 [Thelocarpon impressellum]|nr:MAG: hypothetical protein M1832_004780 [Thelocarpon impressellum]
MCACPDVPVRLLAEGVRPTEAGGGSGGGERTRLGSVGERRGRWIGEKLDGWASGSRRCTRCAVAAVSGDDEVEVEVEGEVEEQRDPTMLMAAEAEGAARRDERAAAAVAAGAAVTTIVAMRGWAVGRTAWARATATAAATATVTAGDGDGGR